ncbi:serine/threonine kinase [Aureococcus anophagefferens]|nr:serine/threonine kinase [Aureococcus anophagefferens]
MRDYQAGGSAREAKELGGQAAAYERRAAETLARPSNGDMKKACKAHNDARSLWLKRKRAFKDVADVMADNMDTKPKNFVKAVADDQCVETDEDAGVTLPAPDALPIPSA